MPVRRAGLDFQPAGAKDEFGAAYFVIASLARNRRRSSAE